MIINTTLICIIQRQDEKEIPLRDTSILPPTSNCNRDSLNISTDLNSHRFSSIFNRLGMHRYIPSPFHTAIPVNYRKNTRTTSPVNTKMRCSQRRSICKAPFTHRFQNTNKFFAIINWKRPINSCASRFCVCKHGWVYAVSVFVDVFFFCVKRLHSYSCFWPRNMH